MRGVVLYEKSIAIYGYRRRIVGFCDGECTATAFDFLCTAAGGYFGVWKYLMQKMTITAEDSRFDDIMKQVVKICRKVEPDCKILL